MRFVVPIVLAVLAELSTVEAQCDLGPIQKLIPTGTVAGDWVVHPDMDGDFLVVGAPFGDGPVANSGTAYVYLRGPTGAWSQTTTLAPASLGSGDWFGKHAAIQGNCIVVGATQEWIGSTGKAFVFRYDGAQWNQEAMLLPNSPAYDGRFGSGVSIDGDYIIVGAYKAFSTGRAYVFHREQGTWIEQDVLQSPDPCGSDSFATHGAGLVDDVAVVGSRYDTQLGSDAGAAFVFKRIGSTWVFADKLLAHDGGPGQTFGWWLDFNGQEAIVGAPAFSGSGPGAAYVFEYSGTTWVETAKLTAPDAAGGDLFGYWTSIYGGWAAVGARGADARGVDSGAAYLYRKSDGVWEFVKEILPQGLTAGDQLGNVALGDRTIAIGALGDDEAGVDAGALYVADLPGAPPVAAFSATPVSGKAPLTVHFNDQSTGDVTSWVWNFGNGYSSTVRNPVFTYQEAGTFSVSLTVSRPCGSDSHVEQDLVQVREPGPHAKAGSGAGLPVRTRTK